MAFDQSKMTASPPRISFRPVRPADTPRLAEIAAEIWDGHDYLADVCEKWVRDPAAPFIAMLRDGQLVGCSRLLPFDRRRAWLESLRIDPALQGQGLGKRMARHIAGVGREMGFAELQFATYFGNTNSIRISKALGFHCIGTYTNLELDLRTDKSPAEVPRRPQQLRISPGLPDVRATMSNDWLFVPADLDDRARFFPEAVTVRDGGCTLVLAENSKYAGKILELCWLDPGSERETRSCIRYAIRRARQLGCRQLHAMPPAGQSISPFTDLGFAFHEREQDVYLYSVRCRDLRL